MDRSHRSVGVGCLVAVALIASMAACGESEDDAGASAEGGSGSSSAAAAAEERLEDLYDGADFVVPKDGPEAQTGKDVLLVNPASTAPTGAAVTTAMGEAADALGWELAVFDGNYSPDQYQEGIREGIARGVDGILMDAIDCPVVKNALQEAQDAGIPVVGMEGADCDELDPSQSSLFAADFTYAQGSLIDWGEAVGAAQADWLIAQTEGDAKVIEFPVVELVVTKAVHDGFIERMESCDSCEVESVELPADLIGPGLQERVEQTLLQNPDANAVEFPYDDLLTSGAAAAIRASGRYPDQLKVIAGTGFPANMELIRQQQGQDAGFGYPYDWQAYAGADLLNRILADAEPVSSGIGVQIYDGEHLPDSEGYEAPLDFKSAYEEIWTGGE